MPDTRKHRGPHPADAELFGPSAWPALREAVGHLSWLLTRGYAEVSALKLVGDRFRLTERQRLAVRRSSCSDQQREHRRGTQVPLISHRRAGGVSPLVGPELRAEATAGGSQPLAGELVEIDGFNLLTTIEAALAGGVILRARDGCCRDMASMHGSYRKVEETRPALTLIGEVLAEFEASGARWLFDSPVSNSGRLCGIVRETAAARGWNWQAELATDPDAVLIASSAIVVSADSGILDRCGRWLNLAAEIVRRRVPDAWLVPLGGDETL